MLITTQGIVIRERPVGENDKFIDVLTENYGIIEASAKGVKKITSKNSMSSQLFVFSKFCFSKTGEKYILNSSEIIKSFYDIRLDIKTLSLASYFADVLKFSVVSEEPSGEVLRLFLNTLHFLCLENHNNKILKSIFELRLMTEIGLMPDLVGCRNCGKYSEESMYFDISQGNLLCCACYNNPLDVNILKVSSGILKALRHIVFSDYDKLFQFRLSEKSADTLNIITEKYLLNHLSRNFKTLDFYKLL